MNVDTAAWIVSRVTEFGMVGPCEIGIRMKDGHIISYFYQMDKHTYHRGLREISVDKDSGLLLAESDYGLAGQDMIADFIDVDCIAMISIIESHASATV